MKLAGVVVWYNPSKKDIKNIDSYIKDLKLLFRWFTYVLNILHGHSGDWCTTSVIRSFLCIGKCS